MSATYIHTQNNNGVFKTVLRILALLYFSAVAATIVYLWCFTKDRFISEATFQISKQDSSAAATGVAQLVLPGLADSGAMDSQVVIGYINSSDLLLELEKKFHLVEHYGSPDRDIVFRMPAYYTLEDRLDYYRKRIFAHYDKDTGLTGLTVDTFDRGLSQEISDDILKRAEVFENTINQNVARKQLDFSNNELKRSSDNVEDLTNQLLKLQNQYKVINPDEAITANLAAVDALRLDRMHLEADLATISRDSPGSPKIETLRSQLRSLNELIDVESAKLSGPEQDRLNQLQVEFKQLQLKLDFAISQRASALLVLEKNRVDAAARSRFFSVIQNPYLPEDVAIPRRPYMTATILCLAILLFLVMRALTHSVFERA